MTRRDVGMLCIFTPQKTLRENAQPYRFWGLLGFPPRSGRIDFAALVLTAGLKLRKRIPIRDFDCLG